jgi:hypothetical protein
LKVELQKDEDAGALSDAPVPAPGSAAWRRWRWGVPLVLLALAVRVAWVLAVPTVPVGDFATYRESANYLLEFGRFDPGFIYMPGFVFMLAGVASLGGELIAQKMIGVVLGSLAAAAIFGITCRLAGEDEPAAPASGVGVGVSVGDPTSRRPGARRCPCPVAVIATLLYALWPAGVALSSVVGTDVPAASLIMLAIWALVAGGDRRPVLGAIGFGALMGLAAYVRAVALPLTVMSAGYWIWRRGQARGWRRWARVAGLTGLATGATLVALLPWALHNRREHGVFSFSDQHGGITALIGANPNSEATYSRALNRMFKDLTGRSVISPPHHETDQLALGLARDWTRFEPAYALGLLALKAERLFWAEWHLLYWPIERPGVLVGPAQRWFAAHESAANDLADAFWYGLVALFAAGVALAIAERRPLLLSLVPFQLALTATYAIFFAEPRYRVPIQMMAFPLAAFAVQRLWSLAHEVRHEVRHEVGHEVARHEVVRRARARPLLARAVVRLGVALGAAVALFALSSSISAAGDRLRLGHRWAATVWTVDGRAVLAKWRRRGPAIGPSPIAGAPNGVHLGVVGGGRAAAEVLVANLPAGAFQLDGEIEREGAPDTTTASALRLTLAEAAHDQLLADPLVLPATPATRLPLHAAFTHPGGPLRLVFQLEAAPAPNPPTVWISNISMTSTAHPNPPPPP